MRYAGMVVGLGNPGQKYAGTRHNCGFMFVDELLRMARDEGEARELNGKKFNALLWSVKAAGMGGEWLAVKPLTFMNDSGDSVRPIMDWNNLGPRQLVVVQDELDLPPGELRFKYGGGLAGHKGLLSISQRLGTKDYYRIRIGIGKPENEEDMLNWVLGRPHPEARKKIEESLGRALESFCIFTSEGLDAARAFAKNGE